MRVITSLQGISIITWSPDDANGPASFLTRDLISFIGSKYEFSLVPDPPPGLFPIQSQNFIFQTGKATCREASIPIYQLTLVNGGVIVAAKNTDVADLAADQIITDVEITFHLAIKKNIRSRYNISVLVIEFSSPIEEMIEPFLRIQAIIKNNFPTINPYFLWRLGFGTGKQQPNQQPMFIADDIANMDFTIERRAGVPPSQNRWHATAPLSTRDHERVLNLIEQTLLGRA